MDITGLLGMLAGMAVTTALFLAFYLLFLMKEASLAPKLLAFLFIAIALRIAKSIWFFIFYDVAPIGLALGYLGLSSIGPLLYLYIRSCKPSRPPLKWVDLIHLLVPIAGIFISLLFNLGIVTIAYKTATAFLCLYLVIAWLMHRGINYSSSKLAIWNRWVLLSVSMVLFAFIFQHLTETMLSYAIGAGIASIPIYFMLVQALQSNGVFKGATKSELSPKVLALVKVGLEEDHLYKQKNINLNQLANQLGIPGYLVSKAVFQLYGKSIPEAINHFRIEEVKRQLVAPDQSFVKIEGLAYDAGFNSPSAFYVAFKKVTKMTPKQYQHMHLNDISVDSK